MDVESPLVSDNEAAEAADPGEGSLDHPSVAAELLTGFDAAPGDARLDPTFVAGTAAAPMVISLVGMELVWSAAWPTAPDGDGRDRVEKLLERQAIVDVGASQDEGERNAAAVGDEVAFGAGPASVGRVRAGGVTPFLAAMDELSMPARLQSIRSASRSLCSNSRCSRSHTPAACQSRSRRQHVTPDPHPISAGSISHGMPVRRTNRMPVSAARAGTAGRPPFGFATGGGSSGSIIDQSASDTRGVAIPLHESPGA
jgi:hypothetical protein